MKIRELFKDFKEFLLCFLGFICYIYSKSFVKPHEYQVWPDQLHFKGKILTKHHDSKEEIMFITSYRLIDIDRGDIILLSLIESHPRLRRNNLWVSLNTPYESKEYETTVDKFKIELL